MNILNYTRRDGQEDSKSSKKQRQLEQLKNADNVITSSSFGLDWHKKYPGYHFCAPCKNWDNRPMENKRLNRKMKSYKCEISHTSYTVPG